jgi:DNA-binding response OmpR family regulator
MRPVSGLVISWQWGSSPACREAVTHNARRQSGDRFLSDLEFVKLISPSLRKPAAGSTSVGFGTERSGLRCGDPSVVARIRVYDTCRAVELFRGYLERHGFTYDEDGSPRAAGAMVSIGFFDAEDLDTLRKARPHVQGAIAFHASRHDELGLYALEAGADDAFSHEGNARELLARLRALHRRLTRDPVVVRWRGGLRVDRAMCQLLTPGGQRVQLTAREFDVLSVLAARPSAVMSRAEILDALGEDGRIFDRAVDCIIHRLRKKLHSAIGDQLVVTHPGAGYAFRS